MSVGRKIEVLCEGNNMSILGGNYFLIEFATEHYGYKLQDADAYKGWVSTLDSDRPDEGEDYVSEEADRACEHINAALPDNQCVYWCDGDLVLETELTD